jgi:hypothetical protein
MSESRAATPNTTRVLRTLVHRGHVDAEALLFDEALAEADVMRRVLLAWEHGASLVRTAKRYILRWPKPRRIAVRHAHGAPLVRVGAHLVALPVRAEEIDAALPGIGPSIVFAEQGALRSTELSAAELVCPSRWLDVDGFAVEQGTPLGEVFAAELVVPVDAAEVERAFRGVVGDPAKGQLEAMRALAASREAQAQRTAQAGSAHDDGARANAEAGGPTFGVLGELLAGIVALFAAFGSMMLGAREDGGTAAPSAARSRGLVVHRAPEASSAEAWPSRMNRALRSLFARALLATRLASLVGKRQAAYLTKMLELFEAGDLDEALRYAIPLGAENVGGAAYPSLGVPSPRDALAMTGLSNAARGAWFGSDGLMAHLQQTYRAAFDKLDRDGDVERAAFVLAELLRASHEAVSYLEKHGRYRLAAELAEVRELPPGVVVRAWYLAGETGRAIDVARVRGAFADAVQRLERDRRGDADALRLLWADHLAAKGAFATAVEVVWSHAAQNEVVRPLCASWVDRALERRGPASYRMFLRKLELDPDALPDIVRRAQEVYLDPDVPLQDRLALAGEVSRGSGPGKPVLARAVLRAFAADPAVRADPNFTSVCDELAAASHDGALRIHAKRAKGSRAQPGVVSKLPLRIVWGPGDVGEIAAFDSALLPDGRILVALGEAGLALLGRDGKRHVLFETPAHAIVLSDEGDRAIVVARRGKAVDLARVDLVSRRAEHWCTTELRRWASTFDGSLWFVATARGFLAIDAMRDRFRALHHVPLERGVVALARSPGLLALVLPGTPGAAPRMVPDSLTAAHADPRLTALLHAAAPKPRERWLYELPSLTLRSRVECWPAIDDDPFDVDPAGRVVGIAPDGELRVLDERAAHEPPAAIRTASASLAAHAKRVRYIGDGLWLTERDDDVRVHADILDRDVVVELEGAGDVHARSDGHKLLLGDDHGRLCVIDARRWTVLRDHRTRVGGARSD